MLKGLRALPVMVIVQYTFDKMNVYFLKHSMETDAQMAGENKRKYKYKFPPKVDEWLEFQSRKTESQESILYDNKD